MKFFSVIYTYILFSGAFTQVNSINILTILPYHGRSHFIIFKEYVEGLARRGHNVTVISFFPRAEPLNNYHDISLTESMNIVADEFAVERSYKSILGMLEFVVNSGIENCKVLLQNEEVQQLWKAQMKFDVIIVEQFNTDCALGLAFKLDAPVVGITSHSLMAWHYSRFGIPYNPAYVRFQFLEGGKNPTIFEKVERLVLHAYFNYRYSLGQKIAQDVLAEYFENVPPLEELARNIKILLLYTNNILFGSTLLPANVIEVHGHHITQVKPLPKDLQQFMDEAIYGVIYISFGSIVRGSTASSDMIKTISSVLSELPQRIVWKWEDVSPPGNLHNIYYSKWLPQNDILAHPNVQAFYSHCGLGSTTEAVHFGVPIVGMPILGDQPSNADAIEENGFGVKISISELTKDKLLDKFKTVLNPAFRERVKNNSKIWRDRPLPALDSAVFWTEYVARHKNYQFRSAAADVSFYQYLFLDVIFVMFLSCGLIHYVYIYVYRLVNSKKIIISIKKMK